MKSTLHRRGRSILGLLGITFAAACGEPTGVDGPRDVALNFRIQSSGANPVAAARSPAAAPMAVVGPPLVLTGTNGTLTIDEIRLIVAEAELDGEDDACESDGLGDDCADFEAPPRFLDLPLDGEPVEVFVGVVPPGIYDELEFEIEDLEDDEEDSQFAAEIDALMQDILAEFPDWPRKATALVAGSFESPSAGVIPFRVFLEAEIEVEIDLSPPLVVSDEGTLGSELTVDIRPDIWFGRPDGSVLELYLYDYGTTGMVLEFEVEMEDGFTEIEIGS